MALRRRIPDALQRRVRQRANGLCEYCHAIEKWQIVPFTIDHAVPLSRGGTNDFTNLALACFHCNRQKSASITATDPTLDETVDLFNPRRDVWSEHFAWSADFTLIIGQTPRARAAIVQLRMNRRRIIDIRLADAAVGRHPPQDDPVAYQS